MKVLAALLLVSLMQQIPKTSSPSNAQNNSANPSANRQTKEPEKANGDTAGSSFISIQTGTGEDREHNDGFDKGLHRAYETATIFGVLFGLVGLYFIWKQSGHTESAAKTAKESADAALLNARSIINSERPWLFIEIKTSAHPPVFPGVVPESMSFCVKFRNWGKTPAEVVAFDNHPDCRKNTSDLPETPEYALEGEVMAHTRMVPPGESWEHPGEPCFTPESFLLDGQWKEIRNSQKRLIYWGRIQYRDLIEESKSIHELKRDKPITIHETCFCYLWSPRLNEFLMTGPLGYNKHT